MTRSRFPTALWPSVCCNLLGFDVIECEQPYQPFVIRWGIVVSIHSDNNGVTGSNVLFFWLTLVAVATVPPSLAPTMRLCYRSKCRFLLHHPPLHCTLAVTIISAAHEFPATAKCEFFWVTVEPIARAENEIIGSEFEVHRQRHSRVSFVNWRWE